MFLDCYRCDDEYLRQNVTFVEYVRDRAVADVHVLVTTQETGGGGIAWTLKFIGLARFQGQDRTLSFTHDADGDRRRPAQGIRARLQARPRGVRGRHAGGRPKLDVTYAKPKDGRRRAATKDPWNYWVFRAATAAST